MRIMLWGMVCAFILIGPAIPAWGADRQPKLLIEKGGWTAYRERVNNDARLKPMRDWLVAEATRLLDEPVLKFKSLDDENRNLTVARLTLMRTMVLAQAFHLTDDPRFAERGKAEVMNAVAFPDWAPKFMLDAAEMMTGVSIGYDWLYDQFTDAQRKSIRDALLHKGIESYADDHWFWKKDNNWNQVCLGGLTFAALILEEDQPDLTAKLLGKVREHIPFGLKAYEPDGIPYESPAYWSYGATYTALTLSALQTAKGVNPDTLMSDALKKSAQVRALLDGPSRQWFGYGDNFGSNRLEPSLLFYANVSSSPHMLQNVWNQINDLDGYIRRVAQDKPVRLWLMPLTLVWVAPTEKSGQAATFPDVWSGMGKTPMAILRSHAPIDQQLFVGIKGGTANVNHGQMDVGAFVIDAKKTRFAMDLDGEEYGKVNPALKGGLWNMKQGSPRWSLVRYHNLRHNTLTIDDQEQRIAGKGELLGTGEKPSAFAVFDLSATYAGQASRVIRGVRIVDNDSVEIADRVEGLKSGSKLTWTWITDATITSQSDRRLKLTKNGVDAWLCLLTPADEKFEMSVVDADRREFESPNPGATAIRINLTGAAEQKIVVRLVTIDPAKSSALEMPMPELDPSDWLKSQ